jgi:hypothetical protein
MSGTNVRWVDNVGHVMIDEVSIEIGGQTIN